jgi:hypothetical protein
MAGTKAIFLKTRRTFGVQFVGFLTFFEKS